MIDVTDRVADYLSSQGFDVSLKRLDLTTGKEGVVVIHQPETVAEEYYDGERSLECPYAVVSRRRSQADAMAECNAVVEALEGVELPSANGSYAPDGGEGQRVEERPRELGIDDKQLYAWQARMTCRVAQGGSFR